MKRPVTTWIAWALAVATTFIVILQVIEAARSGAFAGGPTVILEDAMWSLIAAVFAVLAALIISKEPGNVVGWVLMILPVGNVLGAVAALRLASFDTAPTTLDPGLWLAIWFSSMGWVFLIFPIFHLLQVFPTGRVLSPRWRWLIGLELLMVVVFMVLVALTRVIGPLDGDWTVENPIGLIPEVAWEGWFDLPWTIGLMILTLGGALSTILRYRRARGIERQQIKWLLAAFGFFAAVYALSAAFGGEGGGFLGVLFVLSIISIPVAMTVAVLRYRLFDIDLIIRRTLVYAVLTGFLTAVYLGSVVALQSLFQGEENSSLSVAGSTLLTIALFTPLRRRIQTFIDRRLFRSKYNAQKVIEQFGGTAQNQANLEKLSADLLTVIEQTIQPRFGHLWIRETT